MEKVLVEMNVDEYFNYIKNKETLKNITEQWAASFREVVRNIVAEKLEPVDIKTKDGISQGVLHEIMITGGSEILTKDSLVRLIKRVCKKHGMYFGESEIDFNDC